MIPPWNLGLNPKVSNGARAPCSREIPDSLYPWLPAVTVNCMLMLISTQLLLCPLSRFFWSKVKFAAKLNQSFCVWFQQKLSDSQQWIKWPEQPWQSNAAAQLFSGCSEGLSPEVNTANTNMGNRTSPMLGIDELWHQIKRWTDSKDVKVSLSLWAGCFPPTEWWPVFPRRVMHFKPLQAAETCGGVASAVGCRWEWHGSTGRILEATEKLGKFQGRVTAWKSWGGGDSCLIYVGHFCSGIHVDM